MQKYILKKKNLVDFSNLFRCTGFKFLLVFNVWKPRYSEEIRVGWWSEMIREPGRWQPGAPRGRGTAISSERKLGSLRNPSQTC